MNLGLILPRLRISTTTGKWWVAHGPQISNPRWKVDSDRLAVVVATCVGACSGADRVSRHGLVSLLVSRVRDRLLKSTCENDSGQPPVPS